MLDTNIFIVGYSESESAEERILDLLATAAEEWVLLLSDELHDQLRRVARRVRGRDWVGTVLSQVWHNYRVDYVSLSGMGHLAREYAGQIPREDLAIFVAAVVGRADVFVSRNRELLQKAAERQGSFECLTPEEFLARLGDAG
jgi:predicted nucleic acid-binding protein